MIALIILVIIAVILLIGIWVYMVNEVEKLKKRMRKLEWRMKHDHRSR